jgi:hypothetical protein
MAFKPLYISNMLYKLFRCCRFIPLFTILLSATLPAHATIQVQHYWHMGESDINAVAGANATVSLDSVGTNHLIFDPAATYSANISTTSATDTGSILGVSTGPGPSGTTTMISSVTDNFGLEFWVKANTLTNSQSLVYNGHTSGTEHSGWGIYISNGAYHGLQGNSTFFGVIPVTTNVWIHLALVRNHGLSTLYSNGIPIATTSQAVVTPAGSFVVGADNCTVDEVRMFTFAANQFTTNDLLFFQNPVFALNGTNFSESTLAGNESVVLTINPTNVSWTASANASWLHLTKTNGVGNTQIPFSFDVNPGPTDRTNTLTIAGLTVTVTQPAPTYFVSATSLNESAVAGSDSVSLTVTPSNTSWTATANAAWLHVPKTSGKGSTNITFSYDDNSGVPRSGTLIIGNQAVTVSQSQATISYPFPYTGFYGVDWAEFPGTGGTFSIPITVTPNAGKWSASASASWIHVITTNATGSTNLMVTIDPNTPGTVRHDFNGISFQSVGPGTSASSNGRFMVYQGAPTPGPGQFTYRFTGKLAPYLAQLVPSNASAALQTVQNGDIFYLSMTFVTNAPIVGFETYACGVNNLQFTVPSRGLSYSASFEDLEVSHDMYNPNSLRWQVPDVDANVTLDFWARDFDRVALLDSSIPTPLNLSGFHNDDSFAEIALYLDNGENPTLFSGDVVPFPSLNLQSRPGTNTLWWVTTDITYPATLQSTTNMNESTSWVNLTNTPTLTGLTNSVALPPSQGSQFFRLKIL